MLPCPIPWLGRIMTCFGLFVERLEANSASFSPGADLNHRHADSPGCRPSLDTLIGNGGSGSEQFAKRLAQDMAGAAVTTLPTANWTALSR